MRIVRYERNWKAHYGLVEGEAIYELRGDVYGEAWPGEAVGKWGEVKLLAPCTPHTIWSNGANYPSRCHERGFPLPTEPHVLWSPGTMICGPEAEIRIPEFETRSEYGAELGIVLRRDCNQVEEAEAEDSILGYTALNNVWIKDPAHRAYERPLRVYDQNCPVGPVVDTALDWRDLAIRLRVGGEPRQDDRTASMLFSPPFLVSWISRLVPMRQGDLIMTGTPGGVEGHVLRYGETVEVEIEGIGTLRNVVTRIDTGAVTYIVSVEQWLAERARSGER
ncbi:MAG: fumarylacetoacetate hydrolase family protein [Chloroflexi bacterium]|nr:fumarylacetoacetate hydrolase family protein [Chloroflexota bacterium]